MEPAGKGAAFVISWHARTAKRMREHRARDRGVGVSRRMALGRGAMLEGNSEASVERTRALAGVWEGQTDVRRAHGHGDLRQDCSDILLQR